MKKILIILLLLIIFSGCGSKNGLKIEGLSLSSSLQPVLQVNNQSFKAPNDLLFHDYSKGLYLTSNSTVTLPTTYSDEENQTILLYAIRLETGDSIRLQKDNDNPTITFTPKINGHYQFQAVLEDGVSTDLTERVVIETYYEIETGEGLIPLN